MTRRFGLALLVIVLGSGAACAADYTPVTCATAKPYAGPPRHAAIDLTALQPSGSLQGEFDATTAGRLASAFDKAFAATRAHAMTVAVAIPGRGTWTMQRGDARPLFYWASTGKQATATIILLPGNSVFLTGRLLSAGVRGILARCARPEAILPTIEKVLAGEVFVDPELSDSRPRPDSTAGHVDAAALTSRELEVLRLIGQDKTYKDIGSLLGLSIKTVGAHRENIKSKLNLGSGRALHLVAKAYVLWESSGVDYLI